MLDGIHPCDVVILTQALIDGLIKSGEVVQGSDRQLGAVKTGIACKVGAPRPDVDTADSLRQSLLNATAIYVPDIQGSTAGIHFMKVLTELGIAAQVSDRLCPEATGVAAMKALADCDNPNAIGCTQVTEIIHSAGVQVVAELPAKYELATVYTAGVCTASSHPDAAAKLIELLVRPASFNLRQQCGFVAF